MLNRADLETILELSCVKVVPKETALMVQGVAETFACYILSGRVRVEVESEGLTSVVATIGKNRIVGELGAFVSSKRLASVYSDTPCVFLKIEQDVINKLLVGNPNLALGVIKELGARIADLNEAVTIMTTAATALGEADVEQSLMPALQSEAGRHEHLRSAFQGFADDIQRKRARQNEMNAAECIQQSLLPPPTEDPLGRDRFSVSAKMLPASEVGGDFFDHFMVDDDTLLIAVGDVCGKGVPAALVMSMSRTILRAAADRFRSPSDILQEMNRKLMLYGRDEPSFVAMAVGVLDLRSGDAKIGSAGLGDVHVVHNDAGVSSHEVTGPAVGIIEDATFGEVSVRLAKGDLVVFATDGVCEANDPDGNMFRTERMMRVLEACAGRSATETLNALSDRVHAFSEGASQFDDITMLALQYLGHDTD